MAQAWQHRTGIPFYILGIVLFRLLFNDAVYIDLGGVSNADGKIWLWIQAGRYRFKADQFDLQFFSTEENYNIINTGGVPLKLFTLYDPPNHRDGVVHHTHANAEKDNEHFD